MTALPGSPGDTLDKLLQRAVDYGTGALVSLARTALGARDGRDIVHSHKLLSKNAFDELVSVFAAVLASSELLGRAMVRDFQRREYEKHAGKADESRLHVTLEAAGSVELFEAGLYDPKAKDKVTDGEPVDKPASAKVVSPESALDYFTSLVPSLTIDRSLFLAGVQRRAFTLAAAADAETLTRVQGVIADRLKTGKDFRHAAADIDQVLTDAGVSRGEGYASMVFRTNAKDAYETGFEQERQHPDVIDTFPVWMYSGVGDGRERPTHRVNNGKFYPAEVSFSEVRDAEKGEYDGYNCRCVSIPISKWDWKKRYAKGARVAEGYRDVVPV